MLSIQLSILSDLDANMRFNLEHGMWTTGINSAFELIQGSKNYTVKDIDQKIRFVPKDFQILRHKKI
jgi:hypothetical protein